MQETKVTIQEILRLFLEELSEVQNGETIRIVSGEANWKIFNNPGLVDSFRRVKLDENATIQMIAGPVLSIEDKDKMNSIINLTEDKIINLYISNQRREHHFRIYGMRKLWKESYHPPLATKRYGCYITNETSIGLIAIGKYISDFDSIIKMGLAKKSIKPRKDFVFLTQEQITKLRQLTGNSYNFDLLDKENVKRYLQ